MKNGIIIDTWTQIKLVEICVNTRHRWPNEKAYKRCQNIIKGLVKPGSNAFQGRPITIKPLFSK